MTPAFDSSSSVPSRNGHETPRRPSQEEDNELHKELERYGVKPVQLAVFDWGGYRYTSASDALAAAKRGTS